MIKKRVYSLSFFLLFIPLILQSYESLAEQTFTGGTLQAYWRAAWNEEATINTPELRFRYFPAKGSPEHDKIVEISFNMNDAEKTDFIKNNFQKIPAKFLKYKEWYVNQKGDLTINQIKHYIECDTDHYIASFVSFKPVYAASDATSEEKATSCNRGGFPYLTFYTLKADVKAGQLKSEPSETAKNSYTLCQQESIIKIETINDEWMYAAVYDSDAKNLMSSRKGYIKIKDLTPLN